MWAQFKIICEWKGVTKEFTLEAPNALQASEMARKQCKQKVGMPPSSVVYRIYVKDVPPPRLDESVIRRAAQKVMYDRRP
jgi:hypothetical protein